MDQTARVIDELKTTRIHGQVTAHPGIIHPPIGISLAVVRISTVLALTAPLQDSTRVRSRERVEVFAVALSAGHHTWMNTLIGVKTTTTGEGLVNNGQRGK